MIKKDEEEQHCFHLKGKIYQDKLYVVNISVPYARNIMFVNKILLKIQAHIEHDTTVVGDFNSTLLPIDKSWKQKLNRDIVKLTEVMNQTDLICETNGLNLQSISP